MIVSCSDALNIFIHCIEWSEQMFISVLPDKPKNLIDVWRDRNKHLRNENGFSGSLMCGVECWGDFESL